MKKVGFIGFGNMGSALVEGLTKSDLIGKVINSLKDILIYDKDESKLDKAKNKGLTVFSSSEELITNSDIIFLCVKPKDLKELSLSIRKVIETYPDSINNKVIVSILAGTKVSAIYEHIGNESIPIVRVMPNTPALVGEGCFGVFFTEKVKEEDKKNNSINS